MSLTHLFIADPFLSLKQEKDTSCQLMKSALTRKHGVFFSEIKDLCLKNKTVFISTRKIREEKGCLRISDDYQLKTGDFFDCIWVRKDPPFNNQYLELTWILDFVQDNTLIINSPKGIRSANEKIWAMNFSQYMPTTVISSSIEFVSSTFKEDDLLVLKPTDLFGGQGITKGRRIDKDFYQKFQSLSSNFTKSIIIQKYIEEAVLGDKRVLVWQGEILGAVLRKNDSGFINNFFAGGKAEACQITNHEKKVIKALKPFLLNLGLNFVGVDFLGKYLTEINVTSPTCLVEMNTFAGRKLENKIFDEIETKLA